MNRAAEEPSDRIDGPAAPKREGRRHQGEHDDTQSWQRANHGLDLLISPADEPREPWLRQALERSGALAWPGRHRRLLGALAALLVVVAVGVDYLVTRPPPRTRSSPSTSSGSTRAPTRAARRRTSTRRVGSGRS